MTEATAVVKVGNKQALWLTIRAALFMFIAAVDDFMGVPRGKEPTHRREC